MTNLKIRLATHHDIDRILAIYGHYVTHTAITFEYEVPTRDEMMQRMDVIQAKYPYLVALVDDEIIGYAYASDFRYKAAYQWSPESTIYLDHQFLGRGIGKSLYRKLFDILCKQGFYNVYAGVTLPNEKSESLHRKCGFTETGVFKNIGYKHGNWHSIAWFQQTLEPYVIEPPAPRKFSEMAASEWEFLLAET